MRNALGALAFVLLAACMSGGGDADAPAAGENPSDSIPVGETGGLCGGFAGFQCRNENEYCEMKVGECVSIADAAGTCAPKPEICTMDYRPVCGCDGETYANACAARGAGASIASPGECGAARD